MIRDLLTSLTARDYFCIFAAWGVVAVVVGIVVGHCIRGAEQEEPNFVVDDLLDDAPAEILAVDERDRQFFAIVNAERWFVDGAA